MGLLKLKKATTQQNMQTNKTPEATKKPDRR